MVFFFLLFLQICQNYGKKTQVVDSYIVESLQNGRILENLLAQKGKCAITGKLWEMEEIHCHHKTPKKDKGDNSYENLIILQDDVHKLVHATKEETIQKYMKILNLTPEQLQKLNKLRISIGNAEIKM